MGCRGLYTAGKRGSGKKKGPAPEDETLRPEGESRQKATLFGRLVRVPEARERLAVRALAELLEGAVANLADPLTGYTE